MKQWTRTVITSLLLVAMLFTVCAFSACEGNGGSGDDAAKIEELTQQLSEAEKKLKEAEAEVERLGEQVESLKMTVGGTDNIDYMLSTDGSSYIAIGPKEGCTDSHFEIATVYEGLPVTATTRPTSRPAPSPASSAASPSPRPSRSSAKRRLPS